MKWKFILLILILIFNIEIFSQEFYQGYRVVTWDEIAGMDYSIFRDADGNDIIRLDETGEIVIIIKYEL